MVPPPDNFTYNSTTKTLSWDSVPNVNVYRIMYKPQVGSNWQEAYLGGNTQCSFGHDSGTYDVEGQSQSGEEWGVFGPITEIII